MNVMDMRELKGMDAGQLVRLASGLEVEGAGGLKRQELLFRILQAQAGNGGQILCEGVLEKLSDGYGFLRARELSYLPGPDDVYVSPNQIRRFGLATGDHVVGQVRPPKPGERYFALARLDAVNGVHPETIRGRKTFDNLTPLYPEGKIRVEIPGSDVTGRVIDLMTPLGRGQRGLIVSPPRTGKTMMLQHIANAIAQNHPEMVLIVLLVDERPEEVTDMRRTVRGEVVASSSDEMARTHVAVAEIVLERAKRLVECGRDVVVLLDSITRLSRAYNNEQKGSGRVLSGGIDARTMEKPRRFFGAARKCVQGGSLTVIGTALVDTGSRMDEVIFQEFKGTGNTEIVMDRGLFERRIFPAIDISQTGTRKEEKLYAPDEYPRVTLLRRALAPLRAQEAMQLLVERVGRYPTNEEFLKNLLG